jgi:hypothetical protein
MKFSIGDKVSFLNEKGEGTVSRMIGKDMVGVTIEDGFELPFHVSELVSREPVAQAAPTKQEAAPVSQKNKEEGIYLAVSPTKPSDIPNSDFSLWLINHTDYEIMYVCSSGNSNELEVFDRGEAPAWSVLIVADIGRKVLDDFANVKVEILFFTKKKYDHRPPVSELIKIKPARLYKENAFALNDFIPEGAILYTISRPGEDLYFNKPEAREKDLSSLLFSKQSGNAPQKQSKPHTKNVLSYDSEIDLHIEELMDDYSGMSNAEIIKVQLQHFQNALDKAINERCRTLTVIHGVGNGRLKQEVRALLLAAGLRFHDASYSKYGFGATEVLIG